MKLDRGDIDLVHDEGIAAAPDALPLANIPYGFAKRCGVALIGERDGALLTWRCAKAPIRAR